MKRAGPLPIAKGAGASAEPRTTREVLEARERADRLWKLRSAFDESLGSILQNADLDDGRKARLIEKAVEEFLRGVKEVLPEAVDETVQKAAQHVGALGAGAAALAKRLVMGAWSRVEGAVWGDVAGEIAREVAEAAARIEVKKGRAASVHEGLARVSEKFPELGRRMHEPPPPPGGAAYDEAEAIAKRYVQEGKAPAFPQALARVLGERPDLYRKYATAVGLGRRA
jgi:hypothetical protein